MVNVPLTDDPPRQVSLVDQWSTESHFQALQFSTSCLYPINPRAEFLQKKSNKIRVPVVCFRERFSWSFLSTVGVCSRSTGQLAKIQVKRDMRMICGPFYTAPDPRHHSVTMTITGHSCLRAFGNNFKYLF